MPSLKSSPVAYLLWFLCLIGLCGMHRFYAGKWITGLLWFCTGGLFLVGQFIDLFLIPGMVERNNLRAAVYHDEYARVMNCRCGAGCACA